MKKQDGIALIATLLIMAAIMALGVGTLFLANMNLRIAENSRTHAIARYNAEAGMEAAFVKLKQDYQTNRKFPSSLNLPLSPDSTVVYGLNPGNGYVANSTGTTAEVRVLGKVTNSTPAQYLTEALVTVGNGVNPAFLIGLTSEGPVRVTGGGGAEYINAGVHSNVSVDLTGYSNDVFRNCNDPAQAFSTCAVANPTPVSTSDNNYCTMTGCNRNAAKVSIDPAYTVKRNDTIANTFGLVQYRDANGNIMSDGRGGVLYADPAAPSVSININPENNANVYQNRCTVVYSASSPPPAIITSVALGAKICAKDGISLNFATGINMTGATVIADGNITFGGGTNVGGVAGTLKDTKLISRTTLNPTATDTQGGAGQGGVMLDNVSGENLTIYTGANRNTTNSLTSNKAPYYQVGSGFKLKGDTTIASNRDIQFDGQTQLTTYPDKAVAITTAIISTRKITNSGRSDFYGVFWAGQCFEQSGSAMLYGSVAVQNKNDKGCNDSDGSPSISSTGKFKINTSYRVDNSSLYGANNLSVASRR